ncbi:MAG: hypothetical protein ISR58_08715 [Anaerolineales bacterium]|nr:hypothetical protein [Chloroflexota bacterium]MBL6981259.1 hypothetical protein [Anaerolineales bacterium]
MNRRIVLLPLVPFILLACNLLATASPTSIPTVMPDDTATPIPTAEPTAVPTSTSEPTSTTAPSATASPPLPLIPLPEPGTVAYDFVANVCEAQWANSISYISPCPSNLDEIEQGYITNTHLAFAESNTAVEVPSLIVVPQQAAGGGTAIFGIYPPFEIWPGDQFRATLSCQGDAACDVEYSLEYFDAAGKYQTPNWVWDHQVGDGPQTIAVDLSSLAGQTVKLVLAVRDADKDPSSDYALWIAPHIYRSIDAQPPPASSDADADNTPGVISGVVDMSSAPPYMNDPVVENSMPVVVVFFNLDDGTYWWIQTSLTGHPNYQMTVYPGNYHVVAYGQGMGGEPYVAAGYTGQVPSCGQPLAEVLVEPNAKVKDITIADWNWSCGGDAYRPEKPIDVPLP